MTIGSLQKYFHLFGNLHRNRNPQWGSAPHKPILLLVDAAHIMPFGLFHNDDPRNGIALCKNHHWGFDAGWFTATADYRILASSHLRSTLSYLTAGASLLLPAQQEYAPAVEALAWHQKNVFRA